MQRWDDRILELLDEEGPMRVSDIHRHPAIFYDSDSSVSRRLDELEEYGLVEELVRGAYQITSEGRAYLNEEYDVRTGQYLSDTDEDSSVSPDETRVE